MENLKSITKILMDVDDNLCATEIAAEKSRFQSTQLCEGFSTQVTEHQKIYEWDRCRITSEILFDYVLEIEKRLKTIRKSYNVLWNKTQKCEIETVQKSECGDTETDYKEKIKQLVEVMDKGDLRRLWLIGVTMATCKE